MDRNQAASEASELRKDELFDIGKVFVLSVNDSLKTGFAFRGVASDLGYAAASAFPAVYSLMSEGIESIYGLYESAISPNKEPTESGWVQAILGVAEKAEKAIEIFSDAADVAEALEFKLPAAAAYLSPIDNLIGVLKAISLNSFNDAIEAGNEVVQGNLNYSNAVDDFQDADAEAKELIKEFYDAVADAQQDGVCQPQPPPPLPPPPPPIPPLPPTPPIVRWIVGHFHDPNDIQGPEGFGDAQYVTAFQQLAYTINFENEPTATLPTPEVTVTQQLDPGLDWRRSGSGALAGMG